MISLKVCGETRRGVRWRWRLVSNLTQRGTCNDRSTPRWRRDASAAQRITARRPSHETMMSRNVKA